MEQDLLALAVASITENVEPYHSGSNGEVSEVSNQNMGGSGGQLPDLGMELFQDFEEFLDEQHVEDAAGDENEEIVWPDYLGERGIHDFRDFGTGRRVFHSVYRNTAENRKKFCSFGQRTNR